MAEIPILELEDQMTPQRFAALYVLLTGVATIIVGVVFCLVLPVILFSILQSSSWGTQIIATFLNQLTSHGSSSLYDVVNKNINFFEAIIIINLFPWVFFWLGIKLITSKLLIYPEKNWVATLEIAFLKMILYPLLFFGIFVIFSVTGVINVDFNTIQTSAQFQSAFQSISYYIQLTIAITYGITIIFNATAHARFVPPPSDSALKRVSKWTQQKWEQNQGLPEETQIIHETEELLTPPED
jgi:hypothetical protein